MELIDDLDSWVPPYTQTQKQGSAISLDLWCLCFLNGLACFTCMRTVLQV